MHLSQKRCASVDLSHLSPPQLVSVGIVLPGTRNQPIVHRAHGWHRSRRCICPNGSFHDHRTWHHTWCHSLVQLRDTQRSCVSLSLPSWYRQVPSSEPAERKQMAFPISDNKRVGVLEVPCNGFCIRKWFNTCNSLWNPELAVQIFLLPLFQWLWKSVWHSAPHICGIATFAVGMANCLALLVLQQEPLRKWLLNL